MGCSSSKPGDFDSPAAPSEPAAPAAPAAKPKTSESPREFSRKKSINQGKRRAGVSAEATKAQQGAYVKKVVPKTAESKARIAAATEANALFAGLSEEQRSDVIDAMFEVATTSGQSVIKQGDVGDNFYVVESGEYEVYLKQKGEMPVHTYKAGSAFGELALMYNCPRAATVKTSVAGQLWGLDQVTFRHIVMAANMHVLDDQASFLKSVSILSPLTDEQRADLAGALIEETFEDGEYIVSAGEAADSLYFIKRGEVVAHKKEDGKGGTEKDIMRMRTGGPPARPPAGRPAGTPASPHPRLTPLTPPPPPRRQAPSSARARSRASATRGGRRTWWRWGR